MPDGLFATLDSPNGAMLLQHRLAELNRARLTPCLPAEETLADPVILQDERVFLQTQLRGVAAQAANAPNDPHAFLHWFENLVHTGPGQGDPLFPWLAENAPLDAMAWFLAQEMAGEAGFEDLTALTQLRMPDRPKLEMARNYWDEMGHGQAKGMHGAMLDRLAGALGLRNSPDGTVLESLELANTMTGLAFHRHYAFHAVGALGIIELTAPGRAAMVAAGLKRLGIPVKLRHYFNLHAVLDVQHAASWNAEVIMPLIQQDARRAAAIAEGALIRLTCGARCFRRYAEHLKPEGSDFWYDQAGKL